MSPYSCSFVVPAYNEAHRITATLNAIASFSMLHLAESQIIVVDDGSTDDTVQVARAASTHLCPVSVHCVPHRGKGFAIRQGLSVAQGDIVVLCDADLGESMNEVLHLMRALVDGADIAIGSRWRNSEHLKCGQPLYRRVSGRIFNLVAGGILALPYKDTQCGLKALTREAAGRLVPLLTLDGWGYDPELIYVALLLGLGVHEVDLNIVHDYSTSHFRPLTDGWAAFSELFKIRRNAVRGSYGSGWLVQTYSEIMFSSVADGVISPRTQAEQIMISGFEDRQLESLQENAGLCTGSLVTGTDGLPPRNGIAA